MKSPWWSTTTVLFKQYMDLRPLYQSRSLSTFDGRLIGIKVPSINPTQPSKPGMVWADTLRSDCEGQRSSALRTALMQDETKRISSQVEDFAQFQENAFKRTVLSCFEYSTKWRSRCWAVSLGCLPNTERGCPVDRAVDAITGHTRLESSSNSTAEKFVGNTMAFFQKNQLVTNTIFWTDKILVFVQQFIFGKQIGRIRDCHTGSCDRYHIFLY